jgi:hypothetical protein
MLLSSVLRFPRGAHGGRVERGGPGLRGKRTSRAATLRKMPALWNSGSMESASKLHGPPMAVCLCSARLLASSSSPTTNASRVYGTRFLCPPLPDVCSTCTEE